MPIEPPDPPTVRTRALHESIAAKGKKADSWMLALAATAVIGLLLGLGFVVLLVLRPNWMG